MNINNMLISNLHTKDASISKRPCTLNKFKQGKTLNYRHFRNIKQIYYRQRRGLEICEMVAA